jgi:hypothetical protein
LFSFKRRLIREKNKSKNRFFQTVGQSKLSDDTHLDETTHSNEKKLETVQQTTENLDKNKDSIQVSSEPILTKEEQPTTTKPVHIKKRKSAGLFSCFRNKKAKASTEQRGPPTVTPPSVAATTVHTTNSIQEKPTIDYAILPDGKRIYIDTFRDRPGLDMSYKPNDFDTRFVLPVVRIYQKTICIYIRLLCMDISFSFLLLIYPSN